MFTSLQASNPVDSVQSTQPTAWSVLTGPASIFTSSSPSYPKQSHDHSNQSKEALTQQAANTGNVSRLAGYNWLDRPVRVQWV